MSPLKKQLLWVIIGSVIATLVLGLGLSWAVNYSLRQLENQPDVVIPGGNSTPTDLP